MAGSSCSTPQAGELFAEAALSVEAYHCDAVATEDTQVDVFQKAAVLAMLGGPEGAALRLVATMARQLQDVRARLELRNVHSARERILLWLDTKADRNRIVVLWGASGCRGRDRPDTGSSLSSPSHFRTRGTYRTRSWSISLISSAA